ncbi:MAG TPA: DUF998 domain-containing protein [Anaerolineales bacterium]|nr:DUF998 domain-containing protein [Anaerolineales bacterium]
MKIPNNPFLIAVAYFILIIVIAHFFAPTNYTFTQNTISELASQGHTYKGIMQAGLIGFGAILLFGVIGYFKRYPKAYFLIFVAIYAVSILLSGMYCTAPIDTAISYSIQESNLHSLFASAAGFSMSLGMLWQVFSSLNERERWMRIICLGLIGGLSGLFGLVENEMMMLDKGMVQRMLYLVGLLWLVFEERMLVVTKEIS